MATRVAIYARYSSDLQSDHSIADQVRLCRERLAALGGIEIEVYSDAALSGAHARSRPGLQRLLLDAAAGRFDLVLAEALDRISRDQEDVAGIFKRLSHRDVTLLTVAEGEIGELHIGLKGTMNALFLKDLAQKVRRGQRGRIAEGRATAGIAYGYRVVRQYDDKGEPVRGLRAIDEARAAVVRRIYADYIAGRSPRQIAIALNREGVPGPRGGKWNTSSISGHRQRRRGILNNEIYAGRLQWGRETFRKNPETGRKIGKPVARSQWAETAVPELAIVDAETWAVALRLKDRSSAYPAHRQRRPKHMLSGLVLCGRCGGRMIVYATGRMICGRFRERGDCTSGHTIPIARLERRVIEDLRAMLLSPAAIERTVKEAREEKARQRRAAAATRTERERELRDVRARIGHLVAAIEAGADAGALRTRLQDLEQRRHALEDAARPDALRLMHAGGWSSLSLVERYAHLAPVDVVPQIARVWGVSTPEEFPAAVRGRAPAAQPANPAPQVAVLKA